MPSNRGIRRAARLSSERCTSPEDEHASSLKYIEAAYSGDIKPLRDLTQNFQVKLDVLIKYVERLKKAVSDRINYFHAGLILQSSREVYSRKVDYLEMLLDALVRTASSVELVLEKPEADVEQKKCPKRHKQLWPKLDEFKRVSKEEITLLPESQRVVNFDLPKTVRLPPILPMLLMPPMCNHVFLRDTKGDVMGRKGDFRVNWPINRKGMPVDLAKQLNKAARDQNVENEVFLRKPEHEVESAHSDMDVDGDDGAPLHDDLDVMETESVVENGFPSESFPHGMCSTPAPLEDDVHEMPETPGPSRPDTSISMTPKTPPFVPMLDPNTRPKRSARKLPAMMTMTEFITGKKKVESSATKRKRRAAKSSKDPKKLKAKRSKMDPEVVLQDENTTQGEVTSNEATAEETQPQSPLDVLGTPRPSSATPSHAIDWDLGTPDDLDDEVAEMMNADKDLEEPEFSRRVSDASPTDASTPVRQQEEADGRYETWSERIKPILQTLDERPKFNLRDTARTIIQDLKVGEAVPMKDILRHRKPEQVSRNFVALLQLCNTRNVEIGDDSVLLLSDSFKLGAEVPTDGYSDQLMASPTNAAGSFHSP